MSFNIFDHVNKAPLEEVRLTEDGGIVKRIFERGDEGREKPESGEKVHVLYEGRLASDNSVFDKSVDPESPFKFKIAEGQVIKGWDVGIASMVVGERAELVLAPEYAYGESGAGNSIPPNATLIFKVELIQIGKGKKAARYCKTDAQLFEEASTAKERGNELFKAQKFKEARQYYLEACDLIVKIEDKKQEHQDLRKTCLLNSSVASNKLGEYKITINKCTEVTYIDDKNPKCYYLRA